MASVHTDQMCCHNVSVLYALLSNIKLLISTHTAPCTMYTPFSLAGSTCRPTVDPHARGAIYCQYTHGQNSGTQGGRKWGARQGA